MSKIREELLADPEVEGQELRELLLPKVCPTCGSRYSSWTQFCSQDGTALPEIEKCPRCRTEILDMDDVFCRRCGWNLSKPFEVAEVKPRNLASRFAQWLIDFMRRRA